MVNEIKARKSLCEIEKIVYIPGFEYSIEGYEVEKRKNFKAAYEEFKNY